MKTVLITGGTKGIGLETGLLFASQGYKVALTYKWGSVEDKEIEACFKERGLEKPLLFQADVLDDQATLEMLEELKKSWGEIHSFVSNVAFGSPIRKKKDLNRLNFLKTIEYSAWPFIQYPEHILKVFGQYPRYITGVSSFGHHYYFQAYAFVASAKAVLENLCRYQATQIPESNINIVRSAYIITDSFKSIFGEDWVDKANESIPERFKLKTIDVANVITQLSSGMLDGINGEVICVDKGFTFSDNRMGLFEQMDFNQLSKRD
jgi:NAD(P)-dependent dehydrogenase (short-subunit alcohol dehydrogenase family)